MVLKMCWALLSELYKYFVLPTTLGKRHHHFHFIQKNLKNVETKSIT